MKFLGVSWILQKIYREILSNCGTIDTTRKNKKFIWGEEQDKSFLEVKMKLISAHVLLYLRKLKDLSSIAMR